MSKNKKFKLMFDSKASIWDRITFRTTKEVENELIKLLRDKKSTQEFLKEFIVYVGKGEIEVEESTTIRDVDGSRKVDDKFELISYENTEHGETILENR